MRFKVKLLWMTSYEWKTFQWLSYWKLKVDYIFNKGLFISWFKFCICSGGIHHINLCIFMYIFRYKFYLFPFGPLKNHTSGYLFEVVKHMWHMLLMKGAPLKNKVVQRETLVLYKLCFSFKSIKMMQELTVWNLRALCLNFSSCGSRGVVSKRNRIPL